MSQLDLSDPAPSSLVQLGFTALILIIGSGLCSGTEAAIFSVSDLKIRTMAEDGNPAARAVQTLKQHLSDIIGVIVVLNNLFNIVGSIVIGQMMAQIFDDTMIGILSGVFTFLVILFGEIAPKNAGERFSLPITLWAARPLLILRKVFFPIIFILNLFTQLIFGTRTETFYTSEDEIKLMVEEGARQSMIEGDEHKLIHNVFRMNDISAHHMMTPRVNIDWVSATDTLKDVRQELYDSPHSRLLVYGEDADDVTGFILAREALELLAEDKDTMLVSSITHAIPTVSEKTRADSLLFIFQKKQAHIAIVRDEFGGTAGIVTLEDVLEELVGEIVDETDKVKDMRKAQD